MSKKYKADINPKIPTDKEISESMDFDMLMKKSKSAYKPMDFRKTMHKKRTWIMLVISILALALACVYGT